MGKRSIVGKGKVISLCGSTRFKGVFAETQKKLAIEGNIVTSVGLFGHNGNYEAWESVSENMRRERLSRDFVSFVNDGNSIYESNMQYAILKTEWIVRKKYKLCDLILIKFTTFLRRHSPIPLIPATHS